MNEAAVVAERVGKRYRSHWWGRNAPALEDLSLRIGKGESVALVGANGAGKTTLLRVLAGLVHPTTGRIEVFGVPPQSPSTRRRVGYLPERFSAHAFHTSAQALAHFAALTGISGKAISETVSTTLWRVGLAAEAPRRVSHLSTGMIRRLGLAQALLGEPDLLLLDEPLIGLDPEGRQLAYRLLREERARGATILLSSHVLADVEQMCERLVLLDRGRIVVDSSIRNLLGSGQAWQIEVRGWDAGQVPGIREMGAVLDAEYPDSRAILRCDLRHKDAVVDAVLASGMRIESIQKLGSTLEEVVLRQLRFRAGELP